MGLLTSTERISDDLLSEPGVAFQIPHTAPLWPEHPLHWPPLSGGWGCRYRTRYWVVLCIPKVGSKVQNSAAGHDQGVGSPFVPA